LIRQRQAMVTRVSQGGLGRWCRTSLTRRPLFRSARRVIHRRLYAVSPRLLPFLNDCGPSLADDADLVSVRTEILSQRRAKPSHHEVSGHTFRLSRNAYDWPPLHSLASTPSCIQSLSLPPLSLSKALTFHLIPRDVGYNDGFHLSVPRKPPCKPQKNRTSLGPGRWVAPLGGTLRIFSMNPWSPNPLETLLCLPSGPCFRSL